MKNAIKVFAGICSAGAIFLLALIIYVQSILPGNIDIFQNEEFYINDKLSLSYSEQNLLSPKVITDNGTLFDLNFHLFGHEAVREVISYTERRMVVPGGNPFGIKLRTDGILVVGMTDIQIGSININPAKEAGVKVGDILIEIDGKKLNKRDDVRKIVSESEGNELTMSVLRDGNALTLTITPVRSEFDDAYKAGIWVRDSSAGIGTMTFYDPVSGSFAGLGHAVCDTDTGEIMPLASGEIVDVNISGINAGQSGRPGELKGTFIGDSPLGELYTNCECGLFGTLARAPISHDPVPMAYKQEIKTGPATILATISGNKPERFEINIEKVIYSDINPTKNMVIRVTDQYLLNSTGGIVQGMSGSPILQNGKLVGAITHVFVNDPTRGYGIFAENMDKQIRFLESGRIAA